MRLIMPKTYSDKEREYIIKRLKEEGENCLKLYGVRKTTVDELVKRVKIPKGTFYLFYDSKELLLYDVICDLHSEIQTEMLMKLDSYKGNFTCEQLTNLLFNLFKKVDSTCLLQIMTNGELELLMRKLPDHIINEHAMHDDQIMEKFITFVSCKKNVNIEYYSGAMRGIFLMMLHKREIGEEIFENSLKLAIKGLIIQLMEEI